MRPVNSNTPSYQPGEVPSTLPPELQRYLREEQAKLKAAIDAVAEGFAPVVYTLPPKPREGMVRNFAADVIAAASVAGIYRFDGSAWVFLG